MFLWLLSRNAGVVENNCCSSSSPGAKGSKRRVVRFSTTNPDRLCPDFLCLVNPNDECQKTDGQLVFLKDMTFQLTTGFISFH